jgi:hypothetical protein
MAKTTVRSRRSVARPVSFAQLLRDAAAAPLPMSRADQVKAKYLLGVTAEQLEPTADRDVSEAERHAHVVDGEVVWQGRRVDCGLCAAGR